MLFLIDKVQNYWDKFEEKENNFFWNFRHYNHVENFHFSLSCIGEGNGNPLQYSCLEPGGLQSMKESDRTEQQTLTFHFHALEKEMATHSSVLAWRIPGTGEPRGLPLMGLHRVGHDWSDSGAVAAALSCLYEARWKWSRSVVSNS